MDPRLTSARKAKNAPGPFSASRAHTRRYVVHAQSIRSTCLRLRANGNRQGDQLSQCAWDCPIFKPKSYISANLSVPVKLGQLSHSSRGHTEKKVGTSTDTQTMKPLLRRPWGRKHRALVNGNSGRRGEEIASPGV